MSNASNATNVGCLSRSIAREKQNVCSNLAPLDPVPWHAIFFFKLVSFCKAKRCLRRILVEFQKVIVRVLLLETILTHCLCLFAFVCCYGWRGCKWVVKKWAFFFFFFLSFGASSSEITRKLDIMASSRWWNPLISTSKFCRSIRVYVKAPTDLKQKNSRDSSPFNKMWQEVWHL